MSININRSGENGHSNGADVSSQNDNKSFTLHPESLLALFVHELLRPFDNIRTRQPTRLRLVEPLTSTDNFSTWSYDHFRGIFEMELRPHGAKSFPSSWRLANDAGIHYQLIQEGARQNNGDVASAVLDRPRTGSLQQFIQDICAKEDMEAEKWLKALEEEDIHSFVHLSNLQQTEWDNIRRLPMNAKRILKTAVDRERESADDDRRRRFEESSPSEDHSESTGNQLIRVH